MALLTRGLAFATAAFLAPAAFACSPVYEIQRGDTLWDIAIEQLDSVWGYPQIHEANYDVIGPNPHLIYAGDVLDIPCSDGALGEINWSVMPTPESFAFISAGVDVQIIDIRPSRMVAEGVIPGSISIPYGKWRGASDNPGRPRPASYYAELIGNAGIRLDVPILLVNAKDNPFSTGASAVVYWTLKSLGAEQLAILRGGFETWEAQGREITQDQDIRRPYSVTLTFSDAWRATETDVRAIADGQTDGVLLDARPHRMFSKMDSLGNALATTIPSARNLPASPLMAALAGEFDIRDGVDTVIDHYRRSGAVGIPGDVVTFCHAGEFSALNWFYASELASIDNVKLYPESLVGWQNADGVLAVGEVLGGQDS